MTSICTETLDTPATWRGPEFVDRDAWTHSLSGAELRDLESACAFASRSGKPRDELERDDFPLPILAPTIADWLDALQNGRGFVNVRGLPIDPALAELALWGIGRHLGSAVSQNAAGDLLGHVRDTGADPADTSVRLYKTRVELGFHSDGSDLVALMCLRQGRSGGENRFVSTTAVYNEILRRREDLVPLLYEPFHWDRNDEQSDGQPPSFELPICRFADGHLGFFYIPWYIRKAQRHPHVPRLTRDQHALLDLIDAIAADPAFHLTMRLEPGEINFLKNNAALHARTEFVDHDSPERKRHLLRLWLTARGDGSDGDAFVQQGIPVKSGTTSDSDAIASADTGRCS